jgi:hypothetical protein
MRTRPFLTATALGAAIAVTALAAPAASAKTVEGKIAAIGDDARTVTINKRAYRVSDGAKVLVSGKPGSFDDLKAGMTCKATVAYGREAKTLTCKGKGR